MKFAGYILAFYIVLLTAVPCCSLDNCSEDKTEQNNNHKQSDNDCSNCSPFFNCTGCSGFAFTTEPLIIHAAIPTVQRIFTDYKESFIKDMHYEFWKPPKIA